MKDSSRIKLKIIDILRKELPEEEFLLISSIAIKDSDKDKQMAVIDKAVVEELTRLAREE